MKNLSEIKANKNLTVRKVTRDGGSGIISIKGKTWASVIWSYGGGWDHVSVKPFGFQTPTWEQMCKVKDMFFGKDECCMQLHPARKDYVDLAHNCLHIWKPQDQDIPTPPRWMV